MSDISKETLGLVRDAHQAPNEALAKAWTQAANATTGITAYDLEGPAKSLIPVITPLRNEIPRVSTGIGTQANWRAVTGINTGKVSAGVSEGNRGGVIATATTDYIAAYRGLGLEDSVTFEADYAAKTYDDVKAIATTNLLRALMIQEESIDLGGNGAAVSLGVCGTVTATGADTGGALTQGTWNVICVPLTLQGYLASSVAGGVQQSYVRTNADGSTDTVSGGAGGKSASATGTVGAVSVGSVTCSVAAITGAVAYAWYWGLGAGNEVLGAITTINSYKIVAVAGGTQNASAISGTDNSKNALVWDGLLYQALKSGSGAYFKALATGTAGVGTTLTGDGAGGVTQIDDALQSFWDNYRLSPEKIWVSSQEQRYITAKVLAGASNAAQRYVFDARPGAIGGGTLVTSYLNKFTMTGAKEIPMQLHPNLPPGTILFTSMSVPYPLSNVTNVVQKKLRQDYYQIEWPRRSRKFEFGVYCDGVLQNYFPPAFGVITNIAPG